MNFHSQPYQTHSCVRHLFNTELEKIVNDSLKAVLVYRHFTFGIIYLTKMVYGKCFFHFKNERNKKWTQVIPEFKLEQ